MHVPLNEPRLKCLPQKLRCHSQTYNLENVLRHKRGFTGANLWYKYYLCVKGGSLLTSVLHRARFNVKLAKLSIIQCNAQPMMQMMRRGTPFFITLQQETENRQLAHAVLCSGDSITPAENKPWVCRDVASLMTEKDI